MSVGTITLLAGSRTGRRGVFASESAALVNALSNAGYDFLYGGGETGLMGTVADSALATGAQIEGIMPGSLVDGEGLHKSLTRRTVVDSMAERKALLFDGADAVVVLPGGIGTLEEFFDVYSAVILGDHRTPVIVYDVDCYWQPLQRLLNSVAVNEFMSILELATVPFVDSFEQVLQVLRDWAPPPPRWSSAIADHPITLSQKAIHS